MEYPKFLEEILNAEKINILEFCQPYLSEIYITVEAGDFSRLCYLLHKRLNSAVKMFFAEDLRESKKYRLYCVFLNEQRRSWVIIRQDIPSDNSFFASIAKDIHSASLFEREIREMFGIEPQGNPDLRRLRLHDEVWPQGFYPLRKDFTPPVDDSSPNLQYKFKRVEGEGIFEVLYLGKAEGKDLTPIGLNVAESGGDKDTDETVFWN